MAHIELPSGIPGIGAAFAFRPETAKPMRELAHILLFEPGDDAGLSTLDRELIASYVSSRNTCYFCQASHGAAAAHHPGGSAKLVAAVCGNPDAAEISPKLKALLAIAAHVQGDAKTVTAEMVERARGEGATDLELHDTVLIAAAFCMYNRYVDGLGTWQPRDEDMYRSMGQHLAEAGYAQPVLTALGGLT
jgi:uncharacterized peroxidase-related enzyme